MKATVGQRTNDEFTRTVNASDTFKMHFSGQVKTLYAQKY